MKKFELCFTLEDGQTVLVPALFPEEKPNLSWTYQNTLNFQYHYDVMLGSIISRFMVRMHTFIDEKMYWRAGVVLKYEGNRAWIEANETDKIIAISIAGNEKKRTFLDHIRFEFKHIHKNIKLNIEEKVPFKNISIDYNYLCTLERNGQKTFIPQGLTEVVSVSQLLNGIEEREIEKSENLENSSSIIQHIDKAEFIMGKKTVFDQSKQTVKGDQYNANKDVKVTKVTESANRTFENTGKIQGSNVNLGDNSTQTITARDINFGTVNNQAEFISELKKLQQELDSAIKKNVFPDDIKFDVGNRITKAVKQAEKSEPKGILKHLGKLGGLVSGVNAAMELLKSINDAKDKAIEIFKG